MTRRAPDWVGPSPARGSTPRARPQRDDWASAGPIGAASRTQALISRTLTYGLWTAIGLSLVLGLVNCAGSPTTAPRAGSTGAVEPAIPPPGGCAELTVAAWLANDSELLADVPGLSRNRSEPGRRQADRTYAVSVTPGTEPDSWTYLVGAQVRERDPDSERWLSAGTQFFSVTLVPSTGGCAGWSPATLPARVAAPTLGGALAAPYQDTLSSSGTPLSETLQAFFSAFLTGTDGLERYLAPGADIVPFQEPPYSYVELVELRVHHDSPIDRSGEPPADGTVVYLLATVSTHPDSADLPLVYPVVVGVRGGRWEVVTLDPAVESGASTPTPSITP